MDTFQELQARRIETLEKMLFAILKGNGWELRTEGDDFVLYFEGLSIKVRSS